MVCVAVRARACACVFVETGFVSVIIHERFTTAGISGMVVPSFLKRYPKVRGPHYLHGSYCSISTRNNFLLWPVPCDGGTEYTPGTAGQQTPQQPAWHR